jgi:hypothetical protein
MPPVRKPIRSLLLSLLLPLLMLASQQGALWHEVGHLSDTSAPAQDGKRQPIDRLCEQCLAYAQMATAATPAVPVLPLLAVSFAAPQADTLPFVAADAPRARSRGPPSFL